MNEPSRGSLPEIASLQKNSFSLASVISAGILDNGYKAEVTILKTDPAARPGTAEVIDFLKKCSITYGVRLPAVNEVIESIKTGPVGKKIIVAEGQALVEGIDGKEEYNFRTSLLAGKEADHRIDFRERGLINNVYAQQVIAQITVEVPGKPGMRVDGAVVSCSPIRRVTLPEPGPNVSVKREGTVYTFTSIIAGHARLLFNELQVNPDLIITGDLDFSKGNIDFVGNVEIMGSVKSGFSIRAGGDIIIGGDVESDAILESQKSITVRKTITCGKNPGKIVAGKDITAHRVINSLVCAKGNILVRDTISGSIVRCDGMFATSFAKIINCEIEAIGGIVAHTIGVESGNSSNKLNAGLSISVAQRLEKIEAALEKNKNDMALLAKQVTIQSETVGTDIGALELSQQEKLKRINAARSKHAKTLKEEQEKLLAEKTELLPQYRENPSAKITIKSFIYPTCHIHIGKKEIKVLDEKKEACTLEYSSQE